MVEAIEGRVDGLEQPMQQLQDHAAADVFIAEMQGDVQLLKSKVASLEKQVKEVTGELAASKVHAHVAVEAKKKVEQKVLLGQIAYTFSEMFKRYVFADDPDVLNPPSLQDMVLSYSTLTAVQQRRFDAIMQKAGMSQKRMLEADKYLRRLGQEPTHGSWGSIKATTLHQLEGWASAHCTPEAAPFVLQYVRVLAHFPAWQATAF